MSLWCLALSMTLFTWAATLSAQTVATENKNSVVQPAAKASFAFSFPEIDYQRHYIMSKGKVGLSFPSQSLYFLYSGGGFFYQNLFHLLYGVGVAYDLQIFWASMRWTQTALQEFFPYVVGSSLFHGGEAAVGLRLGDGDLDLSGSFRGGIAKSRNYSDDNRLLLQATLLADALIERDIFFELRTQLSFDWLRDVKDEQGRFALRGRIPMVFYLASGGAVRWYLTPYFGYIGTTLLGAERGIVLDFLFTPDDKIEGHSMAGLGSEWRFYPFDATGVPILNDLFLSFWGRVEVFHLRPRRLVDLEEFYETGAGLGFRLLKAVLTGVQLSYAERSNWQINLYLKGER